MFCKEQRVCTLKNRDTFQYSLYYKTLMSIRTEAISNIEKRKIVFLAEGRSEKRIYKRLHRSQTRLEKARGKFIEHQQARNFSLWIMGGSRFEADSPEVQFTTELTRDITNLNNNISIVHGAGPGIMDAAARGFLASKHDAIQNGRQFPARNYAVGFKVPWEEKRDLKTFDYYIDHKEIMPRVQELSDISSAVYVGPGSLGTAFELLTVAQLMQAKHLEPSYAVILHPSWKKLVDDCREQWYTERVVQGKKPLMGKDDLDFFFSDNIPDIVSYIAKSYDMWEERIGKKVRRGHFWNKKI